MPPVLEGHYSPSGFDDEQPSAAPHVDLEQVVDAINDLEGADYSAKSTALSALSNTTKKNTRH
jgi:hypothetical protein